MRQTGARFLWPHFRLPERRKGLESDIVNQVILFLSTQSDLFLSFGAILTPVYEEKGLKIA